jgi:uncharacterized membrane protein YeaQ/YmgE (transglycosylase-associated protein family)
VIVGAIGGATLGAVLALAHPSYPDQVVVSLAGAVLALAITRVRFRSP